MEFYSYLSLFPLVVFLERCSSSVALRAFFLAFWAKVSDWLYLVESIESFCGQFVSLKASSISVSVSCLHCPTCWTRCVFCTLVVTFYDVFIEHFNPFLSRFIPL